MKYIQKHEKKVLDLIRKLYEAQGYNQTTWGEKLGYSQGGISHIETGMRKLKMNYIEKSAEALGVTVLDLIEGTRTTYDDDDIKLILKLHELIRNKHKNGHTLSLIKKMLL